MRHLFQLSKYFTKARKRIKNECSHDLKTASKYALQTGNWLDFQQARWWAERLKINAVVLGDKDNYEAPAPKSGYDHLGYHVAQSGVFRDQLRNLKGRLSFQEKRQLERHIHTCKQFGNNPEIWKLSLLKLRHTRENFFGTFNDFVKHFLKCQYRPFLRILLIAMGG